MRIITLLAAGLTVSALLAQTTVTTGPTNTTQTYYSLQNGVVGSHLLADWDLAFEINAFNSSILVNTAKGLAVFETPTPIASWASVSTPDEGSWTEIHNSETSWSAGALTHGNNLDQPDGFNLGWGEYSMITHTVVGSKIYVIRFVDSSYRKLRINGLAGGAYSFTYANLDGSDEQTKTLMKSAFTGKNFGYFSFATGATADLEPAAADWDLLFTKYIGFVPTPYAVAGVLQNKQVDALQVDGVPTNQADAWSAEYDSAMNVIGSDWKTFNMSTFQYEYAQNRTYFVKDRAGSIWKLVFTGYGGASTGDMTFNDELVSATNVTEQAMAEGFVLAPNPVSSGSTSLFIAASINAARLSVIDMSGRAVLTENLGTINGMSQRALNVEALPSGMYLVRLQGEGVDATARLVKE